MNSFVSHSLKDTEKFAQKLAKKLYNGAVVLLYGDLGAGKTTLSKSIIKALGYGGVVTSPTFTILNIYQGSLPIYHFDMYRLENVDEVMEIGADEILQSGQGVCLVEWPEKIESILPADAIKIYIDSIDANTRKFEVVFDDMKNKIKNNKK